MTSAYAGGQEKTLVLTADVAAPKKLSAHGNASEIGTLQTDRNPATLLWRIYGGADGRFVLYEDDNVSCDYQKGSWIRPL